MSTVCTASLIYISILKSSYCSSNTH